VTRLSACCDGDVKHSLLFRLETHFFASGGYFTSNWGFAFMLKLIAK
jgi:hypothetical protein